MVRHIPGRLNVLADALSRTQALPTEWMLHPDAFAIVREAFPSMEVDLFATRFNQHLPAFVSPVPDPLAIAIDGLSWEWAHRDRYAFPPFPSFSKSYRGWRKCLAF